MHKIADPVDKTPRRSLAAKRPCTLSVDIGGTYIKASVLNCDGTMLRERLRRPTPKPAPPASVLAIIEQLAGALPPFDRVSAGFPGAVKGLHTRTAPNLGSAEWNGYPLADALAERFGRPARVLNDAIVQGLGVVEGNGLECVITFGTGMGCALFRDRAFVIQLELGQHRARQKLSYDGYVGQAAYLEVGREKWNRRARKVIDNVRNLTGCDVLYIGGGNARRIDGALPSDVKIVAETAGVTGGVRLWDDDVATLFQEHT